MEFRTLREDEIDLRVGNVGKNFYTLLLYKDARCDMNILDETIGSENWQREHKEIKGNLYCGVGIWSESKNQWVWKWDCGTESFTEKEKGEASDSFKRACVNATGVGRELYTAPDIYISCETIEEKDNYGKVKYKLKYDDTKRINSMRVKEIKYNEKREIIKLIIVDGNNVQVFPKTNFVGASEENEKKNICCAECGCEITEKVAQYSLAKYGKELCFNCQKKDKTNEVEV